MGAAVNERQLSAVCLRGTTMEKIQKDSGARHRTHGEDNNMGIKTK